jgi:FixJ family two-component response regulator
VIVRFESKDFTDANAPAKSRYEVNREPMDKLSVYVISDDAAVRDSIKDMVESVEMNASMFESLHRYRSLVKPQSIGCLVFDSHNVDLGEKSQRSMLESVCSTIPVILITDRGDVAAAVRGMKSGVVDIVQKPYQQYRLLDSIGKAIKVEDFRDE